MRFDVFLQSLRVFVVRLCHCNACHVEGVMWHFEKIYLSVRKKKSVFLQLSNYSFKLLYMLYRRNHINSYFSYTVYSIILCTNLMRLNKTQIQTTSYFSMRHNAAE